MVVVGAGVGLTVVGAGVGAGVAATSPDVAVSPNGLGICSPTALLRKHVLIPSASTSEYAAHPRVSVHAWQHAAAVSELLMTKVRS